MLLGGKEQDAWVCVGVWVPRQAIVAFLRHLHVQEKEVPVCGEGPIHEAPWCHGSAGHSVLDAPIFDALARLIHLCYCSPAIPSIPLFTIVF